MTPTTPTITTDRGDPLKPGVSPKTRARVLALRRTHSLSAVAQQTHLPLGTVKTICSRSGAFRDNKALRELCTLPEPRPSSCTALAVPDLPRQQVVTGDQELDAVLWLRQVIGTGQAALISKAMEAAKRIKTPLKTLEKRYLDHLTARNPGNPMAVAFGSFGFADLDALAKRSTETATRRHDALARFATEDALFANTPAEAFCIETLKGLKSAQKRFGQLDPKQVGKRFEARPDLMPRTLADCLFELAYWDELYRLRHAVDSNAGDAAPEVNARETWCFSQLARIRPKTKAEAVSVFRYLADNDRMQDTGTDGILLNLIG